MLCSCGHDQERHSGMYGSSNTGPCLRCPCPGFSPSDPAAATAEPDLPDATAADMAKARVHLLKTAADLENPTVKRRRGFFGRGAA